jgi:hypothetical protein
MNAKKLLWGIEGKVGNENNNIDYYKLLKITTSITMSYVLTVTTYKKDEFKKPNIDIENYVDEDRWDYSNECNEWEGGGLRNNCKPKQNRLLDNDVCNDIIRNDEVANILLSLNRKNTLDSSCNDKEDNNGEGENEGDTNDKFDASINRSARELGNKNSSRRMWCR